MIKDHIEEAFSTERALKLALEALEKISRTMYHIETPPVESLEEQMRRIADKAITAIKQALAAPVQEPVDKKGAPCPEFWDWLSKTYNFEGIGNFTKYNMEVAFLAGMQATSPPSLSPPAPVQDVPETNFGDIAAPVQPVAWRYTRVGHKLNPQFIFAGRAADELRIGVALDGGGYALHPSKEHTDWVPLYTTPPAAQPDVPQGWKLVPVEPTPEMLEEFKRAYKDGDFWRERIHGAVCAMLAAAPEQKGNV